MQPSNEEDIVPTLLVEEIEDAPWPRRESGRIPIWGRLIMLVLASIWVTVFVIAALLNPYDEEGNPRRSETHRQWPLNLPECTFKEVTGLPCPSCGMTTSFSLLIHGDVWNSLLANFAGTLLATLGLLFVPWSILCVWKGRFFLIGSLEMTLFRLAIVFLILLFGRWGVALAMTYYSQG